MASLQRHYYDLELEDVLKHLFVAVADRGVHFYDRAADRARDSALLDTYIAELQVYVEAHQTANCRFMVLVDPVTGTSPWVEGTLKDLRTLRILGYGFGELGMFTLPDTIDRGRLRDQAPISWGEGIWAFDFGPAFWEMHARALLDRASAVHAGIFW